MTISTTYKIHQGEVLCIEIYPNVITIKDTKGNKKLYQIWDKEEAVNHFINTYYSKQINQ